MSAEILYPVSEVAELWRCSKEHVYEQIRRGRLRTVNLAHGKAKTRIPESALAAYVRSLTEPPAGPAQPTGPTGPSRPRRLKAVDHPPMPVPPPTPGGPPNPAPKPQGRAA